MLTIGLCTDLAAAHAAAAAGATSAWDLLVLPELFDGGYAALRAGLPPASLSSPVVADLRRLSRATRGWVVGGSLAMQRSAGRPTNSSLILHRGRVVARYDKIHLFRPGGDHRFFGRGSALCRFRIGHPRHRILAGVIICYDLRFPELARRLALSGVRLLIVPARWPRVRADAWRVLLTHRAVENQIFVVGCNAGGSEGGESLVVDPLGKELVQRSVRGVPGVTHVRLDPAALVEARRFQDTLRGAVLLRTGGG